MAAGARNHFLSLPSVPCVLPHTSLGCRDFSKKWPVTSVSPDLSTVSFLQQKTHAKQIQWPYNWFFGWIMSVFPCKAFSPFLLVWECTHMHNCDLVFFLLPPDLAKDRDLSNARKFLRKGRQSLRWKSQYPAAFLRPWSSHDPCAAEGKG